METNVVKTKSMQLMNMTTRSNWGPISRDSPMLSVYLKPKAKGYKPSVIIDD